MTPNSVPNTIPPPQTPLSPATLLPLSLDQDFLEKSHIRSLKNALWFIGMLTVGGIVFTDRTATTVWVMGGFMAFCIILTLRQPQFASKKRIQFIQNTRIPPQLWQNQDLKSLNLSFEQKKLIEAGLKDFFILHILYPKKPLAMPSQLVDKLWHAFILDTQCYENYCKQAFGKLFHHIPDYQFSDRQQNIQMFTWQGACRIQGLQPAHPLMMPRLFAIDGVIGGTMAVGSVMWDSYRQQMAIQYQRWHAQVYGNGSGDARAGAGSANSNCDVGITSDGDCSCGGSSGGDGGGDGCGSGCGGGD